MSAREDGWKRCPDCAELVRDQARRCRFCGWRFDEQRRERTGLLDIFRTPTRDPSLRQTVEEWGACLESGEEAVFLLCARAMSADGYLLVTDLQVCFFATSGRRLLPGRDETAQLIFSQRLDELAEVRTIRRRFKPALLLGGGGETLVVSHAVPRSKMREVARYLQAHQLGHVNRGPVGAG